MKIDDKVDAVYIPDSPSRIKANDYNQIKNEIQDCITEAGLTPTKDVIQLPQALKILTAQSGAEEVAKIEAAGQEQLNAINTAGGQAVQDAQTAANTATAKATEAAGSATEAAGSATEAAGSASAASGSASTATTQATNASASAELAKKWATQTTAEVVSGHGYGAKYYADQAADSASSANTSASQATTKATEASASASQASQSAIDAANSAASARGLQIGTVYFSQSSLATDNPGGLPLWTGEYYVNASTLYPDFYAWVKSHPELCNTKSEYDSAIATYGECPYYVVDEVEGSLRLPKLVNYIKSATALYPWVYAFNAAVPASTAQAAEFTGALAGKANTDLSNCPANYDYVVESYKDDQGNWYRKYKSGWLEQGGVVTARGEVTLLKPFANTAYSVQATSLYTNYTNWSFGINKTSVSSFHLNMNTGSQGAMWEAKGQGAE